MKVKPRYTVIILILGMVLGAGFNHLASKPKLVVETEYRTITEYSETTVLHFYSVEIEELMILLRLTEAEATGGTIDQKINVAHVVLNRVQSDKFPDTIKEVVFQRNQFSPISDKRYYSVNVSKDTIKAVSMALNGYKYHESLWFMNREHSGKNNIKWFDDNLQFVMNDGVHEYFKEDN